MAETEASQDNDVRDSVWYRHFPLGSHVLEYYGFQ